MCGGGGGGGRQGWQTKSIMEDVKVTNRLKS